MLYYVENTTATIQRYCGFDTELGVASPWTDTVEQITLDNKRKLCNCWPSIDGKSHAELIAYFDKHPDLHLIAAPSGNSTYEYW